MRTAMSPELEGVPMAATTLTPPDNEQLLAVVAPADGSVVGHVREFTRAEIDEVFAIAGRAQPRWAALPVTDRAAVLHRFADLLEGAAGEIGEVLMREVA